VPSAVHGFVPDDATFDDLLPISLQLKSSVHFTPVDVARCAATLLTPEPGMSVLDVGAGAGKFCITAALAMPGTQFVGVESRPQLVRFATWLARKWKLSNVRFVHGDALELDWSRYDAFYFYNPFAEHQFEPAFALDHTIDLSPESFISSVMTVHRRLAYAKLGTRVVTYHGYGAPLPPGYELASRRLIGSDSVELWIKTYDGAQDHEARGRPGVTSDGICSGLANTALP
jgi:SAM-dependent methyltransferase